MKLLNSKCIVRGFFDVEKGIVIDCDRMTGVSAIDSITATSTCSDSLSSATPPASICDSQSVSSVRDDFIDDLEEEENENTASSTTDKELIREAEAHAKNHRTLAAARVLRNVKNHRILQENHTKILEKGADIDRMLLLHVPDPGSKGWKLQFQSHTGKHDVICHYKVDENDNMTVRIDTMIPASLAIPLAAIISEVELWHLWMPKFTFPTKMGIGEAKVLKNTSRAGKVAEANLDLPWPISNRVIFMELSFMDLVDDDGAFLATVSPASDDDITSSEKREGQERIEMEIGLVIRKCPADHEGLKKSKLKCDEPILLVTTNASIRPSFNIFTRAFFGPMIICLLKLAERVRSGKLNQYDDVLKQELYDWLRSCLRNLLTK